MLLRSILLLAVVLFATSAFTQGGKSFLKEGDQFRKEGQLDKALERYTLAVQVDPRLVKAWQAKAEVNAQLGNYEAAALDHRRLAELDPGDPDLSVQAAKAYLEIDSPTVALQLLDQALRVSPKHMEALLTMTRTCLANGDIDRAATTADQALKVKATTDSYYMHGLARAAMHDYTTAEFDLEKVLQWNHLYEPAYIALSEVQLELYQRYTGSTMRMRTLEKAIEKCTRALELNPASTDALFTRSKAYAHMKEYSKAIDDVSRCIALGRTDVDVYRQRALYYHGFGQHQNAVNDLNKAILDAPDDADLLLLRAECKEANLQMEEALRDLEAAQKLMQLNDDYTAEVKRKVDESRDRIQRQVFEMNRESDPPIINVIEPFRLGEVAQVSAALSFVKVSGHVRDKSLVRSIVINGLKADHPADEKDPQFVVSIPFSTYDTLIVVQAMDVYENMSVLEIPVERTEGIAPAITIVSPKPSGDRELTIPAGKEDVFIEGLIKDASLIRMVTVNGVNASYAPDRTDPDFTIKCDVKDRDKIVVRAEDQFGNATEATYALVRKAVAVAAKPTHSDLGPTGTTWIIHIDNNNYRNFPALHDDAADTQKMQKAFSSYNVQRTITKKNLSKEQIERFFNIELRDLVRSNKVNTVLVWYSGHGRSIGGKAYWLPVDAKPDDIYSYFNYGSLKSQLQNYSESVQNSLVISDAAGSDPSFYELTR